MHSTKSKNDIKKVFVVLERINPHKENQLGGTVPYSSNGPTQNTRLKSNERQNVNTTNKIVQGDNKLKYVTKVHLERIPLQNLLNYQQKSFSFHNYNLRNRQCNSFCDNSIAVNKSLENSEAVPKNICHNIENIRGDTKLIEKENKNLDLRQTVKSQKSNNNKSKIHESRKLIYCIDKENQTEDVMKSDKSTKKAVSNRADSNHIRNIGSSMLVTTTRNIVGNSNNTLKTPIYKKNQIDSDNKDHKDEYDFIVSPSNTRYKLKKKRKNNKAQRPVGFDLFNIPKFTKKEKKTRRCRTFPRTFQAILTVNPEKKGIIDIPKSNFLNNCSALTLMNNNKLPKPLTNIERVIADIKSNINNKNKQKINSKKQEIPQNIEHDNEDYDSDGINNSENHDSGRISNNENGVNIVKSSNTNNEFHEHDKTVEQEIVTYFGFDENDKSPVIKTNIKENSKSILKKSCVNKITAPESLSTSNRLLNNQITILSDILINPSSLIPPNKTINESSLSLFETSNSTVNDKNNLHNKVDPQEGTISDSLGFDYVPKKGPGANSTMIRPDNNEKSCSWRLDEHLFHYNPHFLMLKQSSLPATDQDSIIDHTFDDSICQNTKKSVHNNSNDNTEKPVVQKSILNFVKLSEKQDVELKEKRVSLFNVNELSPLKESQQQNLPERNPGNVKRNIFNKISPKKNSPNKKNVNVDNKNRPRGRNKENSPTKHPSFSSFDKEINPKRNSSSKNKNLESSMIENCSPGVVHKKLDLTQLRENKLDETDDFGFDSFLIDDKIVKNHDKKQVPTRISIRKIKKLLTSNNSYNEETKAVFTNSPNKIVNDKDAVVDSPQEVDEFPNDKDSVGLFEDLKLDSKPIAKKYERKTPVKRKQRLHSKDSDTEHSVVIARKKKKKDIMNKEEEEEFEKWAAVFNTECEEVNKFDLEIV